MPPAAPTAPTADAPPPLPAMPRLEDFAPYVAAAANLARLERDEAVVRAQLAALAADRAAQQRDRPARAAAVLRGETVPAPPRYDDEEFGLGCKRKDILAAIELARAEVRRAAAAAARTLAGPESEFYRRVWLPLARDAARAWVTFSKVAARLNDMTAALASVGMAHTCSASINDINTRGNPATWDSSANYLIGQLIAEGVLDEGADADVLAGTHPIIPPPPSPPPPPPPPPRAKKELSFGGTLRTLGVPV